MFKGDVLHMLLFYQKGLQCNGVGLDELQELLELAQRKFLRQVIQYADAMETSPFPRLFVLDFLSDAEKESLKTAEQPAGQPADEQVRQCPLAAAEAADAASAGTAVCAEVVLIFLLLILEREIVDHTTLICNFYSFDMVRRWRR